MSDKTWLQVAIDTYDDSGFLDGDLVSWDWIESALDLREPEKLDEYKDIQLENFAKIEMFKNYLLNERQIALENVRGKGYRIIRPGDQAEYAARTMMFHFQKGLKKGGSILRNTRITKLTIEEKRRHTDLQIQLSGIHAMTERNKEDIFSLFNKAGK